MQIMKTLHLLAHMLADEFVLSCDVTRSRFALIFDGHNSDISAFERLNFITADLFSTSGNARNRHFCYYHFRPFKLVRANRIWISFELIRCMRLAEGTVFIEADVVITHHPCAYNVFGRCCQSERFCGVAV